MSSVQQTRYELLHHARHDRRAHHDRHDHVHLRVHHDRHDHVHLRVHHGHRVHHDYVHLCDYRLD